MAYVMANGFPRTICNPDTERFVLAFVEAWMSDLVDTGELETQSFAVREKFIEFWKDSAFDLMELSAGEERTFKTLTEKLKRQSLPPNLCEKFDHQPEQVVLMRQEGIITDAEFKEYGPTLILDYILSMTELANENRRQRQSRAVRIEAQHLEKLRNKAAETGGDLRRRVKWDSNIVDALLAVGVGTVAHPSVIRRQRPPQLREPWLDVGTLFEIMESGLEAVEEEVDEVFDLFGCASLG